MSLRTPLGLSIFVALATLGPRTTRATLLVRSAASERAARGAAVIVGRVESTRAAWEGKRIVTHAIVQTERVLTGAAAARLDVVTPGGTVEGIGMRVLGAPELRNGSRSVLFLTRADPRDGAHRILDLEHGVLAVERAADGVDRIRDEAGGLRQVSELASELAR